jgi:hypothetical protein
MKKLICIAALILVLCSCSAVTEEDGSDFFDVCGVMTLTGECRGAAMTLLVDCTDAAGSVLITVTEPEALAGVEIDVGVGGTYVRTGDITIPLGESAAAGITVLAEAMRLSAEDISEASVDHVTARRCGTDYYLTLGEDGSVCRISWSGGDFAISKASE